ncbi:MAG: HAD family phosphatase [Bacteriovoracaceae bacterium]|nr:HAD family phosphatase [Bacteriovoracaceae bacterium]
MHLFKHVPAITDIFGLHATPKACLFDMDGTLMDTEILHAQALYELVQKHHPDTLTKEELLELCLGQTDDFIFERLRDRDCFKSFDNKSLEQFKLDAFLKLLNKTPVSSIFLPQIKNLLEELKSANIRLALVTSSDRESAMALLKLLEIDTYFELFITKEDTELNKPHPEPYLKAYRDLNEAAENCVIFEDSPTGLQAAQTAAPRAIIKAGWYQQRPSL